MKFLHIADVHIGAKFNYLPPKQAAQRRQDIKDTFAEAVEIACGKGKIADQFDMLLIAGDLFDSSEPSIADTEFVKQQLRKLKKQEIKTYLIAGNHDWYTERNFWEREEIQPTHFFNDYGFDSIIDEELGITIAGISLDRTKSSKHALRDLTFQPETSRSILLYHGAWENFGQEHTKDYPFTTQDVEKIAV